ncbi:MAG: hypothetical protein ACI4T6_10505, partial [Candidatus Flemingiibacterium sp.]
MANYFRGSTTKDAVSYAVGETMVFELELVHDGETMSCPLFRWELYGDDGRSSSGFAPGETGKIRLETSVNTPGFVR